MDLIGKDGQIAAVTAFLNDPPAPFLEPLQTAFAWYVRYELEEASAQFVRLDSYLGKAADLDPEGRRYPALRYLNAALSAQPGLAESFRQSYYHLFEPNTDMPKGHIRAMRNYLIRKVKDPESQVFDRLVRQDLPELTIRILRKWRGSADGQTPNEILQDVGQLWGGQAETVAAAK